MSNSLYFNFDFNLVKNLGLLSAVIQATVSGKHFLYYVKILSYIEL